MNQTLDSRQLQAFAAVARRASFTQAAKDLCLTQSAVSHALRALEENIGCRLLDRVGKKVMLTTAGEQFLRHVEIILREMSAARSSLQALSQWEHGSLSVGASTTACRHILPVVLREFRESFPKCSIRIDPGDHAQQLELLRSGKVDLALVLQPSEEGSSDLELVPLFEDELCFFVSPQHAWASLHEVPKEQLENQVLVLYHRTSQTFRLVQDYLRSEGVTLNNFIELGSMEAIKEIVKLGLGAGIMAPWTASQEIASGALIALPPGTERLKRRWCVAFRKGRRLALAEETFVGLCQAVAENLRLQADLNLKRSA